MMRVSLVWVSGMPSCSLGRLEVRLIREVIISSHE